MPLWENYLKTDLLSNTLEVPTHSLVSILLTLNKAKEILIPSIPYDSTKLSQE